MLSFHWRQDLDAACFSQREPEQVVYLLSRQNLLYHHSTHFDKIESYTHRYTHISSLQLRFTHTRINQRCLPLTNIPKAQVCINTSRGHSDLDRAYEVASADGSAVSAGDSSLGAQSSALKRKVPDEFNHGSEDTR